VAVASKDKMGVHVTTSCGESGFLSWCNINGIEGMELSNLKKLFRPNMRFQVSNPGQFFDPDFPLLYTVYISFRCTIPNASCTFCILTL